MSKRNKRKKQIKREREREQKKKRNRRAHETREMGETERDRERERERERERACIQNKILYLLNIYSLISLLHFNERIVQAGIVLVPLQQSLISTDRC